MILIDANVFLEVLLGRKKAGECEALLNKVSKGDEQAVVSSLSIHGIESFMGGGQAVTGFLQNLAGSRGLSVLQTDVSEEIAVSLLSASIRRDFDDSLQYYLAKKTGSRCIVSFDSHFDGLDILRVEPAELLGENDSTVPGSRQS